MNTRGWSGWIAGMVMLLLLAGCERAPVSLDLEGAMLLPKPKSIPTFSLQQQTLGEFGPEQLQGKWSMMFFGYTRCPDVCPTELFMLASMVRELEKQQAATIPQVVFVSVDGERETIEGLQTYAGYYHPAFLGVTGPGSEVDPLVKSMGVIYERVYYQDGKQVVIPAGETPTDMAYLINHSATIQLINPEGKLHAVFTTPHEPQAMVRDLNMIVDSWKKG